MCAGHVPGYVPSMYRMLARSPPPPPTFFTKRLVSCIVSSQIFDCVRHHRFGLGVEEKPVHRAKYNNNAAWGNEGGVCFVFFVAGCREGMDGWDG